MPATLQLAPAFLTDFLAQATSASHRVWLQSMNFEVGKMMDQLAPVLIQKAKQGLDVRLEIDWVAQRFVHGQLPLLPILDFRQRLYHRQLHRANTAIRAELTHHGVKIIEVNRATTLSQIFPMFRRNHVKLFLVDATYGWVGGVNLMDRAFTCQDFMVRYDQPSEVAILAEQFERINHHRAPANHQVQLNQSDTLLVDAGKVGNSLIYNQALTMITQAQTRINFVSQFVPEGKIRIALLQASQRGVKVMVVTNHQAAVKRWSAAHQAAYRVFSQNLSQYPNLFFRHSQDRVHAKLLIVDDRHALFGSHNLVDTGVLMGTEEIAIQTTDLDLVKQLLEFKKILS